MAVVNISRGDRQAQRKVVSSVFTVDITADPHLSGDVLQVGTLPAGATIISAVVSVTTPSSANSHTIVVKRGGAFLISNEIAKYSIVIRNGVQAHVNVVFSGTHVIDIFPSAAHQEAESVIEITPTITGTAATCAYSLVLTYSLPDTGVGTYTNEVR